MAQAKKTKRHPSALKADRQAIKHQARNRSVKKGVKLAVRAVMDAVSAKDAGKVADLLSKAAAAIDKAAQRGTIHWKAAARKKSRLVQKAQVQPSAV
ncbi:MAG: 30S ribosomal protein S20 [Elusimicrobia bacterium]|nr:30S ribosomal protein S20 [Elusimicrobiota bacterium]